MKALAVWLLLASSALAEQPGPEDAYARAKTVLLNFHDPAATILQEFSPAPGDVWKVLPLTLSPADDPQSLILDHAFVAGGPAVDYGNSVTCLGLVPVTRAHLAKGDEVSAAPPFDLLTDKRYDLADLRKQIARGAKLAAKLSDDPGALMGCDLVIRVAGRQDPVAERLALAAGADFGTLTRSKDGLFSKLDLYDGRPGPGGTVREMHIAVLQDTETKAMVVFLGVGVEAPTGS